MKENNLRAQVKQRAGAKEDVGGNVSTMTTMSFAAGGSTIGIWALICFVGALFTNGPVSLVKGFGTAIFGL